MRVKTRTRARENVGRAREDVCSRHGCPRSARDGARAARQDAGAAAGTATAVAGRDERSDQRRRAGTHRCCDAIPAVAGRAVRRIRAPASQRRHARRAARARLGAAIVAPSAARDGRGRREHCATVSVASPAKRKSPMRWTCRCPAYEKALEQLANAGSRLGPSARRTDAGRHTAHRAVHRRVGRRRDATRAQGTQAPPRTTRSRNCRSASGRFSRSITRKS